MVLIRQIFKLHKRKNIVPSSSIDLCMSNVEIGLRPTRTIVAKIKNIIWRLVNPQ